jgi:hypothetical protein
MLHFALLIRHQHHKTSRRAATMEKVAVQAEQLGGGRVGVSQRKQTRDVASEHLTAIRAAGLHHAGDGRGDGRVCSAGATLHEGRQQATNMVKRPVTCLPQTAPWSSCGIVGTPFAGCSMHTTPASTWLCSLLARRHEKQCNACRTRAQRKYRHAPAEGGLAGMADRTACPSKICFTFIFRETR